MCDELIHICEEISKTLIKDRKNVNTAVIAGCGTGVAGGMLVAAALATVTAGASLGLIIAGTIVGVVGSGTVVGSKVTETVLVKKALKDFHIRGKLLK